eukprot:s2324_g5.t1
MRRNMNRGATSLGSTSLARLNAAQGSFYRQVSSQRWDALVALEQDMAFLMLLTGFCAGIALGAYQEEYTCSQMGSRSHQPLVMTNI